MCEPSDLVEKNAVALATQWSLLLRSSGFGQTEQKRGALYIRGDTWSTTTVPFTRSVYVEPPPFPTYRRRP